MQERGEKVRDGPRVVEPGPVTARHDVKLRVGDVLCGTCSGLDGAERVAFAPDVLDRLGEFGHGAAVRATSGRAPRGVSAAWCISRSADPGLGSRMCSRSICRISGRWVRSSPAMLVNRSTAAGDGRSRRSSNRRSQGMDVSRSSSGADVPSISAGQPTRDRQGTRSGC
jgi:hypothetical protein